MASHVPPVVTLNSVETVPVLGLGTLKAKKIKVKEWNIHYITIGHGEKHLLCLAGGLGNGSTFKALMEQFDPDVFTVIAWDPPGYGMSRPPNRVLSDNWLEEDVNYVCEFMKALHIARSSILGFCFGARVAMLLAAEHPEMVENLILINASSFLQPHEIEIQRKFTNTKIWPFKLMENLRQTCNYSDEEIQELATARFNAIYNLYQKRNGDFCTKALKLIQCKTLVLAGNDDPIVDISHAAYISNNIKRSRLHVYSGGGGVRGHYIHISNAEEIKNKIVQLIESTQQ